MATRRTSDEWQAIVGAQVRAARIDAGLDQARLAALAGVSRSAVSNLELGAGSSLHTLVVVVRALGLTEWLEGLAPRPAVSPMRVFASAGRHRTRERVGRPRKPSDEPAGR